MALVEPGYLRPQILDTPTPSEEKLIEAVCPGSGLKFHFEMPSIWGPTTGTYTGYASDSDLRFRSASGGALSATIQYLLAETDAEYCLHIGPGTDFPWLNELGESRTRLEVINSAGSRYAPSAPLADIVKRLEFPEKFIFVGKPCDVAALRAYAEHDERVNDRVVAMLSFMCGGIPSETGIRKIFATMGIGEGDVTSFRYRGNGWPGQTTATLPDQSQRTLSYEDTWGNILSWHLQKRCKICPDGIGLFADVVFADAWHLSEEGAPLFDEEGGRSLVIARNQLGSEIVSGAMALEYLKAEPEPLERIEKMQPFQAARIRLTASRLLAMFVLGRYIPKFSGLHLLRSALAVGCAANIRSFLGAGLRVLRGRL